MVEPNFAVTFGNGLDQYKCMVIINSGVKHMLIKFWKYVCLIDVG